MSRAQAALATERHRGSRSVAVRTLARMAGTTGGRIGMVIVGLLLLVVLFAPWLAPEHFAAQDLLDVNQPPSGAHWLGTDEFGRDVLSRVIYGSRISFVVGVGSMAVAMLIGIVLGALAAYYEGWLDRVLSAVVDMTWSFPEVLTALLLVAIVGPGLSSVVIAIAVVYLAQFARLARDQVLSLKHEAYADATYALGATDARVLFRHLIPNALPPLIAAATVCAGEAIVLEATLSFLGLGAQPPAPSWGAMLSSGTAYLFIAPWVILFPGLAMIVTVLGFNLLGDALLDAQSPDRRPDGS